jgi:hypothetical protein
MWGIVAAPIGVIVAALIAGWFAVRNARKSPHENLKTLAEIRSALAGDLADVDPQQTLGKAIRFEIEKLDKLTEARRQGTVPFLREILRQRSTAFISIWLIVLIIVGLSLLSYAFYLEMLNAYAYQANKPTADTTPWYEGVAACGGLVILTLFAWGNVAFLRRFYRRTKS